MLREQLILKARHLGIKGVHHMKKVDLEWAIYLKESTPLHLQLSSFNDTLSNTITIANEIPNVSLNVIDLNEKILTDFKMEDISREKQMWLIS